MLPSPRTCISPPLATERNPDSRRSCLVDLPIALAIDRDAKVDRAACWLTLWADAALYFLLSWYLNKVVKNEWGLNEHWSFCFRPSYWGCGRAAVRRDAGGPEMAARTARYAGIELLRRTLGAARHPAVEADAASLAVLDSGLGLVRDGFVPGGL